MRSYCNGDGQALSMLCYIDEILELQMADKTQPRFGFVNFAETWNGRLAMMGVVIGLSTELLTGQSILSQMGLG